jgi:hypothetical protein
VLERLPVGAATGLNGGSVAVRLCRGDRLAATPSLQKARNKTARQQPRLRVESHD